MGDIIFDKERTIAEKMGSFSPGEAIALGIALCKAAEAAADGEFRGGIWPGNITYEDDCAALGPYLEKGLKEMGPDAIEYIAPEQFWKGETSPACDSYSIGLILYTALNGGLLPFFEEKKEFTPQDRAAALQKRMRGNDMVYPRYACRELGDVILCALEFEAEERFSCPEALRAALEALPEEAAIPAVAPVIRLKPSELENRHSYRVDKLFEKVSPFRHPKPPKRSTTVKENMDIREFRKPSIRRRWIGPGAVVLVIIIALALVIRGCTMDRAERPDPDETPSMSEGISTESPKPQTPSTPTIILPSTPTPTPTPPAELSFTVYREDLTWEQARDKCEEMGGHLAVVDSEERFNELCVLAQQQGLTYVWLGSYRGTDGEWYNVDGTKMNFTRWDAGEPSVMDLDGTREDYLLLWYRANQNRWCFNDMRNDPMSVVASYRGKIGYIFQTG